MRREATQCTLYGCTRRGIVPALAIAAGLTLASFVWLQPAQSISEMRHLAIQGSNIQIGPRSHRKIDINLHGTVCVWTMDSLHGLSWTMGERLMTGSIASAFQALDWTVETVSDESHAKRMLFRCSTQL